MALGILISPRGVIYAWISKRRGYRDSKNAIKARG
jgi:hypothetical protein